MKSIKNSGSHTIYIGEAWGLNQARAINPGETYYFDTGVTVMSTTKFYTMPDGNKTSLRPKDGEVFKHQTDPYNYDEWVWSDDKNCWGRVYLNGYTQEVLCTDVEIEALRKALEESQDNFGAGELFFPEEIECDCGCAATYGDDWPIEKHSSYCSLHDTVVELDL